MTELALVPSTGDAPRILHTFKGVEPVSAKLSPDGRFVAATIGVPYADERTDLVLLDVEERSSQLLAERVAPATEPAWTPDGSRVFYLVESTVLDGPRDGWEIPVKAGLPAGPAKKVTSNPGNGSWVVSTANGLLARTVSKVSAEVYTRTLNLTGRSQAGPPQRIAADDARQPFGPVVVSRWALVGIHRDRQLAGSIATLDPCTEQADDCRCLRVRDARSRRRCRSSLITVRGGSQMGRVLLCGAAIGEQPSAMASTRSIC